MRVQTWLGFGRCTDSAKPEGNCGGPFLLGGEYNSESTECGPKPSCRSPLQHFAVFPRKLSGAEIQRHMQAAGIKHST